MNDPKYTPTGIKAELAELVTAIAEKIREDADANSAYTAAEIAAEDDVDTAQDMACRCAYTAAEVAADDRDSVAQSMAFMNSYTVAEAAAERRDCVAYEMLTQCPREILATADDHYLISYGNGLYTCGCRLWRSLDAAKKHYAGREDDRALVFSAALNNKN